jgi:hypothetical protein
MIPVINHECLVTPRNIFLERSRTFHWAYSCLRVPLETNAKTFDLQTEAICFLFIKTIDGMIVVVNPVTSSLVSLRDSKTPNSS